MTRSSAPDNFKWHVSRDFNRVEIGPLDTTLTDYRIDYPFYREDVGDIAQGALGQTSLPLNYFPGVLQFFDFSFAMSLLRVHLQHGERALLQHEEADDPDELRGVGAEAFP